MNEQQIREIVQDELRKGNPDYKTIWFRLRSVLLSSNRPISRDNVLRMMSSLEINRLSYEENEGPRGGGDLEGR